MSSYSSLAAVERTLQVIECLVGEVHGVSVTELVNRTDLSKSMVSRILTTLHENGYIEKDSQTRYYKLSFHFMSLVHRHINCLGLNDIFYPMMEQVANKTGELVQLAVVKQDGIFFIQKIDGIHPLRVGSMLGSRASFHATAAGKVWLASLPNEEVLKIISKAEMNAYTEHTITQVDRLLQDLELVRKRGYAIANQEQNRSVIAVGVPIKISEMVVAMLVVAVPHFSMSEERIEELSNICKQEVANFDTTLLTSYDLGYHSQKLREKFING